MPNQPISPESEAFVERVRNAFAESHGPRGKPQVVNDGARGMRVSPSTIQCQHCLLELVDQRHLPSEWSEYTEKWVRRHANCEVSRIVGVRGELRTLIEARSSGGDATEAIAEAEKGHARYGYVAEKDSLAGRAAIRDMAHALERLLAASDDDLAHEIADARENLEKHAAVVPSPV